MKIHEIINSIIKGKDINISRNKKNKELFNLQLCCNQLWE